MGEELGRIERPLVDSFGGERKVFVVPLVLRGNDAPADYSEKFDLYWQQVREQLAKLEEKIGRIHRIYHEAIVAGGEDGLKIMEKMNTSSCSIVKERCEQGATLEATDDRELAEESMDWERMLLAGFLSEKVRNLSKTEILAQAIKGSNRNGPLNIGVGYIRYGGIMLPDNINNLF